MAREHGPFPPSLSSLPNPDHSETRKEDAGGTVRFSLGLLPLGGSRTPQLSPDRPRRAQPALRPDPHFKELFSTREIMAEC